VPSSSSPSSSPTGPSQFAAERQLLDEARDALVKGDPERALDRVETHRRRFLNPLLAEERDAMEIEALARAGRLAEARARADQFQKRSPDSLFLPTVQSAVESNP
jgi:outer membrane protein assembly factor BamD (BamD/ComL family)